MVARLFRAVAAMDLRVTQKDEEVNAKIDRFQTEISEKSDSSGAHPPSQLSQNRIHSLLSELRLLKSAVSAESEKVKTLNISASTEIKNLEGSVASLKKKIRTNELDLNEAKMSRQMHSLPTSSEISKLSGALQLQEQKAEDQKSKQDAQILSIQQYLTNISELVVSTRAEVHAVDTEWSSRSSLYRSNFQSLQRKINAEKGMIDTVRRSVAAERRDKRDGVHLDILHKLSRELAKVRLKEKSEEVKVSALRKGLKAVEADATLLHDKEKQIRRREEMEQRKERLSSQSVKRDIRTLDHVIFQQLIVNYGI